MFNEAEVPRARILTSWKEIASYLGKGVRTVQRWEQYMELPVRRPKGQDNKVLAHCSDLDAWLESKWSKRHPHQDGKNGNGTHLSFDPLRERCEYLRKKQKLLREQLHESVTALYAQCNALKSTCALPVRDMRYKMGKASPGKAVHKSSPDLHRSA